MIEWSKVLCDKIDRPFVKFCVAIGITSNQVTLFNHFITLTVGCYGFSRGEYLWGLVALGVCLLNGFLDYADGKIARETTGNTKLGIWLDSGFDVIVQNAVMGAISIGCYKMGLSVFWVVMFLIANAANNYISFNYNQTFGFDSDKGNEIFRDWMDRKKNLINVLFKNIIDPTSSYPALIFYTFRYWIAVGMVFNIMPICFIVMTIISNFKWLIMYVLYALYLAGEKRLYVLQGLTFLDEESDEFYRLRSSKSV